MVDFYDFLAKIIIIKSKYVFALFYAPLALLHV